MDELAQELLVACPVGCTLGPGGRQIDWPVRLTRCHEDDSIVGYEGTCQKCGHSMALAFEKEK